MSASISWSRAQDGLAIGFTQIAGLVARRIVSFVQEGDIVAAGQRIGLIRFGSRVDVYLPAGTGAAGAARPADHRRRNGARRARRRSGARADRASDRPAPARGGIPLRAVVPNAITALALCFGLTGVRFAIGGDWEKALGSIVIAGVLDGLDGRIARLLARQSQFGAELDSLSDVSPSGLRRR